MMNLQELMQTNPPRLVVEFEPASDGKHRLTWGVIGNLPIMSLIGFMERVQRDLLFFVGPSCDAPMLVIIWTGPATDGRDSEFTWFVNPMIPVDALVGMLEAIKTTIVLSQINQMGPGKQSSLVGPDGKPISY